jgi:DcuC family C4-dicarboxylate transporter
MTNVAAVISLVFIVVTAIFLYRKHNPQGVLIVSGVLMFFCAILLGTKALELTKPTGTTFFNLFKAVDENFTSNLMRAGFMIMTIGGYVAYMNKIKATNALVYVSMKPLGFFRKYPYLASTITIVIGQMLFITTPSAVGLGLLLVASIYPVLVNLGVSRLTALSVISASTIFDQGPGSANTLLASQLIGKTNVFYFLTYQIPLVIPTTIFVTILYYFNNRYFDKRDLLKGKISTEPLITSDFKVDAPLIFALLPVLPLIMLIVFSPYLKLFDPPITLDTTTAMMASLFISLLFYGVYKRSLKEVFESINAFWKGMGEVFTSVVTLIVAAEIFSKGLINLGFIDALVDFSTHIGLAGVGIAIFISILLFFAAMLMGSGNASFFSFGPLAPKIAEQFGMTTVSMVLPMQLCSSMGRATSPIAGIIVAISGVAGVSPIELAKRNTIPLIGGMLFLVTFHFLTI